MAETTTTTRTGTEAIRTTTTTTTRMTTMVYEWRRKKRTAETQQWRHYEIEMDNGFLSQIDAFSAFSAMLLLKKGGNILIRRVGEDSKVCRLKTAAVRFDLSALLCYCVLCYYVTVYYAQLISFKKNILH